MTSTANDIRLQAYTVAATYGCMVQIEEMKNFFNDPAHTQATMDAFNAYGMPPRNGWKDGVYHSDWCSWDLGMYRFYLAARLFYKYPSIDLTNPTNCKKIKEISDALEVEKLNADKEFVADQDKTKHSYQLYVINDLQGTMNAAFANMSCSNIIATDKKNETIADLTAAAAPAPTDETTTKSTNYILYAVVAIVVIAIAVKLFKK